MLLYLNMYSCRRKLGRMFRDQIPSAIRTRAPARRKLAEDRIPHSVGAARATDKKSPAMLAGLSKQVGR
jgi:hypothetical protein